MIEPEDQDIAEALRLLNGRHPDLYTSSGNAAKVLARTIERLRVAREALEHIASDTCTDQDCSGCCGVDRGNAKRTLAQIKETTNEQAD